MQYRVLGRTGIEVSVLSLGAMNFGPIGGTTQEEATAIVDAALKAGVNLVDTADFYGLGVSEEMVGRALVGRRDDVVLASKAGLPMNDDRNHRGSSRRWLTHSVDGSLRRLGVDHIDLFQVHRWDPRTSDDETLAALTDLQRAGKIGVFGSSMFPAYRIVEAQWAAADGGLRPYVTEQVGYSILQRGAEQDAFPTTARYDMGVLVWSPLASGWLSGAVRAGQQAATHRASVRPEMFDPQTRTNRDKLDAVERLAGVADGAGLTMIQLALGFVTAHPAVTTALIGPRTLGHLHTALDAADTVLSADVLDAIDEIVAPGVDLAPQEKHDSRPSVLDPALRRRD